MQETIQYSPKWIVRKWDSEADYRAGAEPYETLEVSGNLLLNEGITRLANLLVGGGGTAFDNTNARLGVGNSATAAQATDTGLLGASQLYKGQEASYPQISGQAITWRSVFTDAEANFAWEEVTVDNGAGAAENLNRKVQSLGTKASGTWTLDLEITFG